MTYTVASFFTGAMGLDLGFIEEGADIVLSQELDPHAVTTIRVNGHDVIPGDLNDVRDSIISSCPPNLFAVIGGPPCQSFSMAGKRQGTGDPRGELVGTYLDTAVAMNPRFIVMENVAGMLSMKSGETPVIDLVHGTLNSAGYTSIHGVLNAADYGASQYRERVVVIASRDGEALFLPQPTHFRTHQDPNMRWRTLGDVLDGVPDSPVAKMTPKAAKYLPFIPEGGNWRDLPDDMVADAMGGAMTSGGGRTGFYRRLDRRVPSPTLVTSPTQKSTMLIHPTADRPLSVPEYMAIQGFPPDWTVTGPLAAQYRQIGNAVPVPLARAVARTLMSTAADDHTVPTKRSGHPLVVQPSRRG